jgi:hypothetical protein
MPAKKNYFALAGVPKKEACLGRCFLPPANRIKETQDMRNLQLRILILWLPQ